MGLHLRKSRSPKHLEKEECPSSFLEFASGKTRQKHEGPRAIPIRAWRRSFGFLVWRPAIALLIVQNISTYQLPCHLNTASACYLAHLYPETLSLLYNKYKIEQQCSRSTPTYYECDPCNQCLSTGALRMIGAGCKGK